MKFVAHEDVEAPIEYVFQQVTDFPAIERSALRRGAEVQRADTLSQTAPGMKWDVAFKLRGKRRAMQLELDRIDPPNAMVIVSTSSNTSGRMDLELVPLSRSRTRISVKIDMQPKTLAAKLFFQSMKLARGNLMRKFQNRVAEYATEIEARFKSVA